MSSAVHFLPIMSSRLVTSIAEHSSENHRAIQMQPIQRPQGIEVHRHPEPSQQQAMVRAQPNYRFNAGYIPHEYFPQYIAAQPYQQLPPQPQIVQQLNAEGFTPQPSLQYFNVAGTPAVIQPPTQQLNQASVVVTTIAPSGSGIANVVLAGDVVAPPPGLTHAPPRVVPQKPFVQKPRRSILSIVDPHTKECINQHVLDDQRRRTPDVTAIPSSSGADVDKRKPETVKKGRLELKDGKTAAEVQNRFHDAIVSKALAGEKTTSGNSAAAHKQNGSSSSSTLSFTSAQAASSSAATAPEKVTPSNETESISLHDALKEHLSLNASTYTACLPSKKVATPPVVSSTPTPPPPEIPAVTDVVEESEPSVVELKEPESKSPTSTSRSANESPSNVTSNGQSGDDTPLSNGASPSPPADATPDTTVAETMEEKVRRYEEELLHIVANCPNTDLKLCVYSRQFLQLIQRVVKDLNYISCPRTDVELEAIGIDRGRMPVVEPTVKKYNAPAGGRGMFVPDFMQGANNNNASQRSQRTNTYNVEKMRKKSNVRVPNVDRPILRNPNTQPAAPPPLSTSFLNLLPNRAAKPWKPTRAMHATNEAEAEELKLEKLKKEIRGLLNKITPTTYPLLAEDFTAMKCYEVQKSMETAIDIIFEKAVEEPHFCKLYSDLCKKQVDEEYKDMKAKEGETSATASAKPRFCHSIITKCQSTFLQSTKCDENVSRLEEELKAEELEPAKRDEIKEEIDRIKGKEKRRLNGIIRFIADLYGHGLLINPIINWCAVELVKRYDKTGDDVYIEYAVTMISSVGESYEKNSRRMAAKANVDSNKIDEPIEVVFSHLSAIKGNLSQRVRFMIMDLEDLRYRNWKPRRGNTGPKTMDELHKEIVHEELMNQREREEYEKKNRETGGSRRPGGRSYGGRASTDSRQLVNHSQTEKRTQAALNAIHTGSTLRKDTDLKKVEGQQKLGSRTFKFNRSNAAHEPPRGSKDGSPRMNDAE